MQDSMGPAKGFLLVLIKPSHYDDDGYVIQWIRSAIPSNTLAVLNGLALDCAERKVLGDNVTITIDLYDETNTVIPVKSVIRKMKGYASGMIGLVGVQTNQFPRAVDWRTTFSKRISPSLSADFTSVAVSPCFPSFPEIFKPPARRALASLPGKRRAIWTSSCVMPT